MAASKKQTYIDLINWFWREDATERFTPAETRLFFYVLSEINRNRWQAVSISDRLMAEIVGIARRSLTDMKKRFAERGVLSVTNGGRGCRAASVYGIPAGFAAVFGTPSETGKNEQKNEQKNAHDEGDAMAQIRYQTNGISNAPLKKANGAEVGISNAPLHLLSLYKTRHIYSTTTVDNPRESVGGDDGAENMLSVKVSVSRQEPVGNDEFFARYFAPENSAAIEQICMSEHISLDQFRDYARQIAAEWSSFGQTEHGSYSEAARHLLNHLRRKTQAARERARLESAGPRPSRQQAETALKQELAADWMEILNPENTPADENTPKPF